MLNLDGFHRLADNSIDFLRDNSITTSLFFILFYFRLICTPLFLDDTLNILLF